MEEAARQPVDDSKIVDQMFGFLPGVLLSFPLFFPYPLPPPSLYPLSIPPSTPLYPSLHPSLPHPPSPSLSLPPPLSTPPSTPLSPSLYLTVPSFLNSIYLLPSHYHHHITSLTLYSFTLSPSHYLPHTIFLTLSPSHYLPHTIIITLPPSHYHHDNIASLTLYTHINVSFTVIVLLPMQAVKVESTT